MEGIMENTLTVCAVDFDIDYDYPTALVKANHKDQFPRQMPIYLYVDLTADPVRVYAEARNYTYSARSPEEYQGHIQIFELPYEVDAQELGRWVRDELGELIEEIRNGYNKAWFNGNYHAAFSAGAKNAIEEIERRTQDYDGPVINQEPSGIWGLSDWLESSIYGPGQGRAAAEIEGIGTITPHTPESYLVAMAKAIKAEAAENNVVLDGDPLSFVAEIRKECREIAYA
jgi:hypothetical protein